MTLQDLGGLGEFVGAIAVVISLIYLAAQIRQNTRALNSSSYAEAVEQAWLVQLAIAQDGELARIMVEHAAGKPLPPGDAVRLDALLANFFASGENLFRQYELGLVDADTWENALQNSMPGVAPATLERWRMREGPIAKRLLAHLESRNLL